jgi:hypothetical protein
LKTSFAIDLAVSLASGTPFLGKFKVPRQRKVLFLSKESSVTDVLATARRIAYQRGLPEIPKDVMWQCCPPALDDGDGDGLNTLNRWLHLTKPDVVILDPVYRLFPNSSPTDLFVTGGILGAAAEVCLNRGATPIFIHHANGVLKVGQPMELSHLGYAGPRQFARQWMLSNKRRRYRDDGKHQLITRFGKSMGFSHAWTIDVDEGQQDAETGRWDDWDVTVTPYEPAKKVNVTQALKDAAKGNDAAPKLLAAVVKLSGNDPDVGVSYTEAMSAAKLRGGKDGTMATAVRCLEGIDIEVREEERRAGGGRSRKVIHLLRPQPPLPAAA